MSVGIERELENKRHLTRREVIRCLAVGSIAALGVVACAPQAPPAAGAPTPGPAAPGVVVSPATAAGTSAGSPRSGGSLRMGMIGDLASLDPQRGMLVGQARDTLARVWDHLVRYDDKLVAQPALAESWDLATDASSLKLNLRTGVKFHTGRGLTSDDVKWNFERSRDPKISPIQSNSMRSIASMETPDPSTIVFNFSQSWPGVFDVMNNVYILDPVSMQGADGATNPVGTGAFKFAEYSPGKQLRLVKNPDYWRQGLPYVDELVASIYADAQTMVVALESGALDVVCSAPVRDQVRLQQEPGSKFQAVLEPYAGTCLVVVCNVGEPPLDNKQVRQALNYAIDRERILSSVRLGIGQVVELPHAPNSPAYDEAKNHTYAFDLERARSLLNAAGVGPNLSLDFSFPGSVPGYASIAQIYAADLQTIGVTLNQKPLEGAVMASALIGRTYHGLALTNTTSGQFNPGIQFISPLYGPLNPYSGYTTPEYTQLLTQVATETDPVRQKQVYDTFNQTVLDLSVTMPIVTAPIAVVATSRVHGLQYAINESLETTGIWLDG